MISSPQIAKDSRPAVPLDHSPFGWVHGHLPWLGFPQKEMLRQRFKNRLLIRDIQETSRELKKGQ